MVRDDELLKVAKISHSVSDTMKRLGLVAGGGNHAIYKKRLQKLGFSDFKPSPPNGGHRKRPLEEYLVLNGPKISTSKLRRRLVAAGIKNDQCEECNIKNWQNKPINFHLDHIDGNNCNNRLCNLKVLCPNCHSQTPTYGVIKEKNRANHPDKIKRRLAKKRKCKCGKPIEGRNKTGLCRACCPSNSKQQCKCGKLIKTRNKTKLCRQCFLKAYPPPRKTVRPPMNQLILEIKELGYCAVGRKYGVSDNAVRKWVR